MLNRKRIIAAVLCLACVAFSGCGNTANSGQSESTQSSVTEKSKVESSKEVSQVSETTEPSKENSQTSENSKTSSDANNSDANSSNTASSKTESSKTEISKVSETSKANQNSQQSQSNKTEESSKSSQTSKPNQSSKTSDESKPSQHSQSSQSSQSSQNSHTSKPAEASKPAQTSKPAETSKPTETSKLTETSKPSQTSTPSQPSKPATINVSSISLNKSSMTLTVGESSKLTATISPSNATNKNFSWINSNTSVVSVDSNGNVKALKAGTAAITAKTSNGKTAVCNVTVKAKEVSQPAKKKVTQIGDFGTLAKITFNVTPDTKKWGFRIWPKGADTTNLKIKLSDNIKEYVQVSNLRKGTSSDIDSYDEYNFDVKSTKVPQDLSGTYTISCDGVSTTGEISLTSDYDPRYANYYPPFTEAKRNAILKDMREYGEKTLGVTWNNKLYVKWNYSTQTYTTNATFNFPKKVGYNDNGGLVGKTLYDYLVVQNFTDTYKAYIASYGMTWADCSGFKVEVWHNPKDDQDWEFYVLLG